MGEWVEGGDWRLGSRRLAGAQRIGRDQPDLPDRIRVGLVLGVRVFSLFCLVTCARCLITTLIVIKGRICTPQWSAPQK